MSSRKYKTATINSIASLKKYILEHKYKNYVNSWCFNNKNVFTAIRVVCINAVSGQKNTKWSV